MSLDVSSEVPFKRVERGLHLFTVFHKDLSVDNEGRRLDVLNLFALEQTEKGLSRRGNDRRIERHAGSLFGVVF